MSNTLEQNYWKYLRSFHKKVDTKILHGGTILDVGCGEGYDSSLLSALCKKVIAIDVEASPNWKRLRRNNIKFLKADAKHIPFPRNFFNGVFVKDVLHHVESPQKVLNEIKRVAKKGAVIIIVEANRYNPIFYFHMTLLEGHNHFPKNTFHSLVKKTFLHIYFTEIDSHFLPIGYWPLSQSLQRVIELIFTYVPLLNCYKSYNIAIVTNV